MKRKSLIALGIIASLALSGCGGGNYASSDSGAYDSSYAEEAPAAYDDYDYDYDDYDEDYDYNESAALGAEEKSSDYRGEEEEVTEEGESTGEDLEVEENTVSNTATAAAINQEKLVYSCSIVLDTLEYEDSLEQLKSLLKKYDGFLEYEDYSDGNDYSYSTYYVESYDKNRVYNATFRVPTSNYEDICAEIETVGDMRSKNANVQNLTQEYSDLRITQDVLQQTYDRYSALMDNASDEDYILKIQEKLTDTQIRIEEVKSRMNTINRDVAYSTVDVTLREVREYTEEPEPTDTFGQRLKKHIKDSWSAFLSFLEVMLYVFIAIFPFAVLGLIIFLIVFFCIRKFGNTEKNKARKQKKEEEKRRKREEAEKRIAEYRAKSQEKAQTAQQTKPEVKEEEKKEEGQNN